MPRAFISYVRADEDAAKHLAQQLESRGIRAASMDQILVPGQAWTSQVETAIAESDLFFVLLSRKSSRSQGVAAETALAISLADQGRTRVIPVVVDRNAEIPLLLQHVQGLEFFDPEKSQQQLDVLVRSVDKGQPTERDRTSDLEAQLRYVKASKEALYKEISIQAYRQAVRSSMIVAATTALVVLATLLAVMFSVFGNFKIGSPFGWALFFALGVFASVLAFLLTAFTRRRVDSRQAEREKQ